jgi:hypothetical protein
MSEFVAGALAVFILWLLVGFYRSFTGCGGGHVWPDEPTEHRLKVIPFLGKEVHSVHHKETYECQHEDCSKTKTETTSLGDVDFEEAKDAIEEVTND